MKISVSLPDELVKAIDAERVDVSRSRFIRRALEASTDPKPPPRRMPAEGRRALEKQRSPDAEIEQIIEDAGEKMIRMTKPPLQRPIVQKRTKG